MIANGMLMLRMFAPELFLDQLKQKLTTHAEQIDSATTTDEDSQKASSRKAEALKIKIC